MLTTRSSRALLTKAAAEGEAPIGATATQRLALVSSGLASAFMLVASVAGLTVHGLYGDPASTASMLRGYDLVTLAVVVPALTMALLLMRHGSPRAQLVWVGMLAAGVYTYAYHLFGTGFNDAFLLHVAVFTAALFALTLALSTMDVDGLAERFSPRTPVRWIGGLLAFLGVGLGGIWTFYSVWFAATGELPEGSALVETPTVVHLGYTLDLALLVPAYALAAVLLWRRAAWGYVLAGLVLVSGTVHQLGYLVALPFQVAADVPGATAVDPLEPPIALAFLVAVATLLAGLRRSPREAPEVEGTKQRQRKVSR